MAKRELPETDPDKLKERYPGNSFSERDRINHTNTDISPSKSTNSDKIQVNQITTAKVRKKGLLKRFTKYIIADTVESAREKTLMDIVVPGVKTVIFDAAVEMLNVLLFDGAGDVLRGSRRRSEGRRGGRTSYDSYYEKRDRREAHRGSYRDIPKDPDDIILATRREAMDVLEELDWHIDKYEQASIATLYDIVGYTGDFTDNKYGWTDLRGAGVRPVSEGFLLILPQTKLLD